MLSFRLHQLEVPSLGKYLLPLPKLAGAQVAILSAHLEARGFAVRTGNGVTKRVAVRGAQRIIIDGELGLASSRDDMLDALAPAVPALLDSRRSGAATAGAGVGALYFTMKRSGASAQLQLFTRMESLRTWSCLRRDGLCGLTPDEAEVIRHLLARASTSSRLECVTEKPRQGSKPLQVGRKVYYRSTLPVVKFLASLGTIDSDEAGSSSFLPRDSVIELPGVKVDTRIAADALGDWCFVG